MSTTDTMTPLVSAPWFDTDGNPLPVRLCPDFVPKSYGASNAPTPGLSTRRLGHCSRLAADSLPRSSAASTSRDAGFPRSPAQYFGLVSP
jgi:hypothetical protein